MTWVLLSPVSRLPNWSSTYDDRLGAERDAGRRRRRGLRADHQLARGRRADHDVVGCRGGADGRAGELKRDGLGRVVRQVGERGDAAGDRHRGRSQKRPAAAVERGGHLGRVVAGLQVAVLVFDVDHRLRAEGRAGRRRRGGLGVDRQLARGRRADHDVVGVAAVRTGELVKWSVIVSAVSSARSVNVAMPPETVTVVVPCSGPEPIGSEAAVTWVRVVAGLEVAVLVFDVDDGLRAERRRRPSPWARAAC